MFPEGTRHGGSELLQFKKGAFHVAISAQCPVQPVVVSQYVFLDHKERIFNSGKLYIKLLLVYENHILPFFFIFTNSV